MYNDSIEGLTPRKKIRIRNYGKNSDNNYYFEIKTSSVEGRFKKREIINQNLVNQHLNYGFLNSQYGLCFPLLKIDYLREYIVIDDIRITIDTKINYENYRTSFKKEENTIIVELKANIRKNLDELTKDYPFQRIRYSKYCLGIETLNLV